GRILNVALFNQRWDNASPAAVFALSHCTLVPGLGLSTDGQPQSPGAPSLSVQGLFRKLTVQVERSICGPLLLPENDTFLVLTDSIVDATDGRRLALRAQQ